MIDFFSKNGPKILLDQASVMDIGACVVGGVDIAPKRAIPDDGDSRIDHSLEGFLFTCGPEHIRHPEPVDGEGNRRFPLHGSASANAAIVKSLETSDRGAECVCVIPIEAANGGKMLIERNWTLNGETGVLSLTDNVVNKSAAALPIMMMYHINFGAKHFDDGVFLETSSLSQRAVPWHFGEGEHGIFCVPAIADETVKAGDDEREGWSSIRLGPIKALNGLTFNLSIDTTTLPYLQVWRNQESPANILGIEPASHRWATRDELTKSGELEAVAPGKAKRFSLNIWFD